MTADLGRISGAMLKDNLLRGGEDLVFQNSLSDNLLYLNVNTGKVGINTDAITRTLTVASNVRTKDLVIDGYLNISNFNFDGTTSTLSSTTGDIQIKPASFHTVTPAVKTDNLLFTNNTVFGLNTNESIEFRPHGTGSTDFYGDVNVLGNLHSTGDITLDGTIALGNQITDTVNFIAKLNSNLTAHTTDLYDLGKTSNKWLNLRTKLVNGQLLSTGAVSFPSIHDIGLNVGKIWYVATNGSDGGKGFHQQSPFATVKKALSVAASGDTVFIFPGTYIEIFPLTVPQGVTVKGEGIRAVTITPTPATNYFDCFLLNGETAVSDLSVMDFYYDPNNDTGYGFRFADGMKVTTRSPYVQNVSVITRAP
jgi:Protein of unknown function (DUF1565)